MPFPDSTTKKAAQPCKKGHLLGRFRNGRCKECARLRHPEDSIQRSAAWRAANPDRVKRNSHAYRLNNPEQKIWESARDRAKRDKIPFTIRKTDIRIPEFCPLLGIKLAHGKGTGGAKASSPSLDRIKPDIGYVPGNIWVVSYRANMIKNDASLEELRTLVINLAKTYARFPWER